MFLVFPDPEQIGSYVGQLLVKQIKEKPNSVLGLATGSTMLPVYAAFIKQVKQASLDLSGITTYNLDEYIGLAPEHDQSYHFFMQDNLFKHLNIKPEQTHLPNGQASDMDAEGKTYSRQLQAAHIDVQLLGIGTNGHIGFNEPGTPFDSITHVIELTENTRKDNSRFFDDVSEMPTTAITMGMADIMSAKQVVLVITGEHKAQVVADLFNSSVNEQMPASLLKKHPNSLMIIDEAAAKLIPASACQHVAA